MTLASAITVDNCFSLLFALENNQHSDEVISMMIPGRGGSLVNLSRYWAFLLLLIPLADGLFFRHLLGWTIGLYGLLLAGMLAWRHPKGLRSPLAAGLLAGIVCLCVAACLRFSVLTTLFLVFLIYALALTMRSGVRVLSGQWLNHIWFQLTVGWIAMFWDMGRLANIPGRHRKPRSKARHLLVWVVPVMLSVGFVLIFSIANPVLESGLIHLKNFLRNITDVIGPITPARILFWVFCGFVLWCLLRFRVKVRKMLAMSHPAGTPQQKAPSPEPQKQLSLSWTDAAFAVRCLALFNLVFAMQTVMDVIYLWGGAKLPENMSYAEYAHRGAYPLIVTALLAALFVQISFKPEGPAVKSSLARRLVYLWLVQNLFLTISALWRLHLYVEAYTLTRMRVAAAIWMLLVLTGVALILIRIVRKRDNKWLVQANMLATLVLLFGSCLINLDGVIARYNVVHCAELKGEGPSLDLSYLRVLKYDSIPALRLFIAQAAEGELRNQAIANKTILENQVARRLESWRAWTWQLARLKASSDIVVPDNPVPDQTEAASVSNP